LYTFSGKLKEAKYGKRKCSKNVNIFDPFDFTFVIYTPAELASNGDRFDKQTSLGIPGKKEPSLMMPSSHGETYEK
jgi:alkyl hydroperoxide reductase subunit AhpC